MSEPDIAVSLSRCFYCGGDGEIVLNSLLTRASADRVRALHGHIVSMNPCHDCGERMQECILLIPIDSARSTKNWNKPPHDAKGTNWMPNPYRTGALLCVTENFVTKILSGDMLAYALRVRWLFIEDSAVRQMGLYEQENDNTKDAETSTLTPNEPTTA